MFVSLMYLTDEPQIMEYFQRSIDGNQTDGRMYLANFLIQSGRGKVLAAIDDHIDYRPPLGGELVSLLSEYGGDLLCSWSHGGHVNENDFHL